MKKFLITALITLPLIFSYNSKSISAAPSFTPRIVQSATNPNGTLLWDYNDTDLTQFSVDSFKVCYDTTNCLTAALTSKTADVSGVATYSQPVPVTLKNGSHSIVVQACSGGVCGLSSLPLVWTSSLPIPAPFNLRHGS